VWYVHNIRRRCGWQISDQTQIGWVVALFSAIITLVPASLKPFSSTILLRSYPPRIIVPLQEGEMYFLCLTHLTGAAPRFGSRHILPAFRRGRCLQIVFRFDGLRSAASGWLS
jgi:hypothetical protein